MTDGDKTDTMDARRQQFLNLLTATGDAPARKPRRIGLKLQATDRRTGIERRRPSWAA
jgi:hypothetical protein